VSLTLSAILLRPTAIGIKLRPHPKAGRVYAAHLHLRSYTPKQPILKQAPKMTFSNGYNKLTVGYFCAETSQIHSGDTQDQYYIL